MTIAIRNTHPFVRRMECAPSAQVGKLVRQDQSVNNKVEVATDNSKAYQVMGVITKKLTSTLCEVTLRGIVSTSLTTIGRVYLSSTGTFDTIAPVTPGHLQILGYSFGTGQLIFDPNSISTLRK